MKKDEVKKVEEVEENQEEVKETRVQRRNKAKEKKEPLDRILKVLIILVVLEVCMIPCFIYAGMNQVFPIIMFLVLPTCLAFLVLLLSRNTLIESRKKRTAVAKKKEA